MGNPHVKLLLVLLTCATAAACGTPRSHGLGDGGSGGAAGGSQKGGAGGARGGASGSGMAGHAGAGGVAGGGGIAATGGIAGAGLGGSTGIGGNGISQCSSGMNLAGACGTTCNPGVYDCTTGTPSCSQMNAAAGKDCGTNHVCDGTGNCVACTAGGACGTTCKAGTYDCSTGTQVCVQKNTAAGTSCGGGMVCDGNGGCVACTSGSPCGSACNPGTFDCSGGTPTCKGQKLMAAGSTCGSNQVCDVSGDCVACTTGATCGTTCKPGTISCGTGTPVCNQTNAAAGKTCGSNQVCDGSGSCAACTASAVCGTTCRPGTTSCSTGTLVCNQTNAAVGTTCGSNQVCDGSGNCVACAAGGTCGTTCKPGTYVCSTGVQVCSQKNAAAGTSCGNGQVCDGNGSCVACVMNGACGSACNPGTFDCSTGTPVCAKQQKKPPGTSCGTNQFCDSTGSCNPCTPNGACGTTCSPGTYSCTTGAPVCNQSNATLGTTCGSNLICDGGGNCVAKTSDGGSCQSNAQCANGNCSKYAATGASICCATGSSNCGSCVNEKTDPANCGACSNNCGPNRTCQNGGCACTGYTLPSSCGGCGSWAFETGTEGWFLDPVDPITTVQDGSNGATNVLRTTSQHHGGSAALAIPAFVDNRGSSFAWATVPLCQSSGNFNDNGFTVSAWIMLHGDVPSAFGFINANPWSVNDSDGCALSNSSQLQVMDTWYHASCSFSPGHVVDRLSIIFSPAQTWTGTLYIDDVTITGP